MVAYSLSGASRSKTGVDTLHAKVPNAGLATTWLSLLKALAMLGCTSLGRWLSYDWQSCHPLSYLHTNIHTSHGVIFIGGFKYPWLLQTFFSDNPLLIVRRRAIFAVKEIGSVSWKEREGWLDLGLFADKPSVTNISQKPTINQYLPITNNQPTSPRNQQSNISQEPTSSQYLQV